MSMKQANIAYMTTILSIVAVIISVVEDYEYIYILHCNRF